MLTNPFTAVFSSKLLRIFYFLSILYLPTQLQAQALSCTVTSPANGSTYIAPTSINLKASTTVPTMLSITKVEFYVNNAKVGEDNTSPYSFFWTNVGAGSYSITAVSIASNGTLTTSLPKNITVNPPVPPTVSLTQPSNNTVFAVPANITMAATASAGTNSSLTKVVFYANGVFINQDFSSPYSVTWSNASAGTYSIVAIAYASNGTSTASTPRTISITASVNPTVSITQPTNYASFSGINNLTISAVATAYSNGGNISKVEFFDGTTKLGEDLNSPFNYTWVNPQHGSHQLTATATDNNNNTATSTPVNITINQTPSITLTAPSNGTTYTQPANITLQASPIVYAGASIEKVVFYINGIQLGEDNSSPYSYNTGSLSAGTYTLSARAIDNAGRTGYSNNAVVTVSAPPPTIYLISPTNNSTYTAPANITLSANATANGGATITKVEFYNGTTKLGEDFYAPYTFSWANVQAGTYSLYAKAIDSNNLQTNSTAVNVTVNSPTTPPTVSLISPTNNSIYTAPANINLSATANANSNTSINKVEFYNGTIKLGQDFTAPYTYSWVNVQAGTYSLYAKAIDNNNLQTNSTAVNVTVNSPTTPPTVSLISPTNNSIYTAPANINLSANATANGGATITKVEFYNGTTKLGQDFTAPYTYSWANVQAGAYSLYAKAIDNNNLQTNSTAANVMVNSPTTPPTVSLTAPANNSSYTAPANINLSANATANGGATITKVEFYNGTTKLGEDFYAPYTFSWANVQAGAYSLYAKAIDNNNLQTNSTAISITVNTNSTTTTLPVVSLTHPLPNSQYYLNSEITLTAQAGVVIPPYLDINNTQIGWVKLKIGYDPNNLWGPMQNVISGGNTTLEITVKDFDNNANWNNIRIYPQGNGNSPVQLSTYWAAAQDMGDGWKKMIIPLSAFYSGINFSALSYFEFPYSANAGDFHLGVREIKFTGGSTPFLWFGGNKTNNSNDSNNAGSIPAELAQPAPDPSSISQVAFYANNTLIGIDNTSPYNYLWTNPPAGVSSIVARATYNTSSLVSSPPVNINVQSGQIALPDTIIVTATFNSVPTTWSVQKSHLRYNKDFAYSLTLDDGLKDVYSVAFPILNGGTIVENNTLVTYPPLIYTDGCGNDQVFKAGVSWNSLNTQGIDIHVGNAPNYMTWGELDEMYAAGWDVLNHSLWHGAYSLSATEYQQQVAANIDWVRSKTLNSIELKQFVVPSGDANYYSYAYDNGMRAVYNQFWQSNYNYGLKVSNSLNMNNFLFNRYEIIDDSTTIKNKIDLAASQSINGNCYWWGDFTHNCGSMDGPISGGIQLATFRSYMRHIANQYGKNGSDRVWAASVQEVEEYLTVRESSVISSTLNGNQLSVVINLSTVPQDLRRYALTLAINANADFSNVQVQGCSNCNFTYNGNQNQKQLINLQWSPAATTNGGGKTADLPNPDDYNIVPEATLSPNPARQQTTISFAHPLSEQGATLNFYTEAGQLAAQKSITISEGSTTIDLDLNSLRLPKGLYFIDIEGDKQHFHALKLVKM